jgi:hypothetical protein
MQKQFFFFLLPTLLWMACIPPSDDDMDPTTVNDELPPITMQGAQTFGCLLNGEVWVNRPAFLTDNISMAYNSNTGNFNLNVKTSAPENQTVDQEFIFINSTFFEIGDVPLEIAEYFTESLCALEASLNDIPHDDNNYLNISRLDLEENIISGTFAFVLIDTICQDTFRFTDGRFDYDYAN